MDSFDLPRLIYLVILATAILGWFVAENRGQIGKTLRMGLVWVMIFLGVIAGYGLWDDISRDLMPRQAVLDGGSRIEVPRQPNGHYNLTLDLNGTPVNFVVDTGATDIVLTMDDARRIGLDPENLAFLGSANTANGTVRTAYATVDDIALGPVIYPRVRVSVNQGEMRESLLGMSFLNRLSRLEISRDNLILEP